MNIKTENLTKIYGKKIVLNLNHPNEFLSFPAGKIHGILGPNGSGKSTLMKIMAGLIPSTTGKVTYNDQLITKEISKNLTYSTHQPVLFSRSVFDNIAYPLSIRKHSKEKIGQIVSNLLEEFELQEVQLQNAKKLSGGESQKTALARALSFSPKVIFLDEPTANIDPRSIRLMESALLKRNQENALTIMLITHNLSQAFRLCDTITFLDSGRALYSGSPKALVESDNSLIRDFISINTLNPMELSQKF
ncbi:MAG: ABC transporter ATP-binding protein [Eubacteriaceae bacterium]